MKAEFCFPDEIPNKPDPLDNYEKLTNFYRESIKSKVNMMNSNIDIFFLESSKS